MLKNYSKQFIIDKKQSVQVVLSPFDEVYKILGQANTIISGIRNTELIDLPL